MKFGRQGVMVLVLLGAFTLVVAIVSPAVFKGLVALADRHEQAGPDWQLAAKAVVESKHEIAISSQITGVIKEALVDEGDRVKTGQAMIIFDQAKALAQIDIAEAILLQSQVNLEELERGYRKEDIDAALRIFERKNIILEDERKELMRIEQLFTTGAVTEAAKDKAKRDHDVALAELREARANLNKLQKGPRKEEIASVRADVGRAAAELKLAQAKLQDYTILSPIDGLVIKRSADIGETVDIGTPVLTIIDPDNLRIWAELEETDAGKVVNGQSVLIEADALPGKRFKGKVIHVTSAVQRKQQKSFDPAASFDINTQKILITLDDYSGLVHGLTVTVLFTK